MLRQTLSLALIAFSLPVAADNVGAGIDMIGGYRFADGTLVTVNAVVEEDVWRYRDVSTGESYRLYRDTGTTFHSGNGWSVETPTDKSFSFTVDSSQRAVGLTVEYAGRQPRTAKRVRYAEIAAYFDSGDVRLYGKLVLPPGEGPHAAVTIAHGSESYSGVNGYNMPYVYAANGIATLVFDKRGTGTSEGEYTQDFSVLADDQVAAIEWLRTRPEIDAERIGIAGFSQGGWIAPLAATRTDAVSFILIGYGLVMSPAEEDRFETLQQLALAGLGEDKVGQADAFIRLMQKHNYRCYAEGWSEVRAAIKADRDAEWLKALEKTRSWSHYLLTKDCDEIVAFGPDFFNPDWAFYDSVAVMEQVSVPVLWLIGGEDREAPPKETIAALARLREAGKPFETRIFPSADHGIVEFQEKDGERHYTRYAEGYYEAQVQWLQRQAGL